MRKPLRPLVALLVCVGSTAALSADWQTVASDKKRTIELDRASVLQSDPGTKVAWGRIVLSESEAAAAGYTTVKALNRYDCRNQTYSAIKRVYLDAESSVVKDERVKVEKDMPVAPGSVDEKLWRDVCKPADISQLAKNASQAAQAVQPPRTEVRTADYRPARPVEKAAVTQVTEAKAEHGAEAPQPIKKNFIDKPAPPPKAEPAPAPRAPEPVARAPEPPAPPVRIAESRAQALPPPEVQRVPAYVPRPRPRVAPRVVRAAPVNVEAQAAHGPAAAGTPLAHHEIHWSYDGENGPANWGFLKPDWQLCGTGQRQSPIDIRDGVRVDLEPIRFDYKLSNFRIVDNGHTVQVNVGPGSSLAVMGRYFDLVQFHFHRPSEERINGKGFEMVVHLVHKDLDGRLAVVAVLIERGKMNPVVQTLWNNLPLEKNVDYAPDGVSIDLDQLLPGDRSYYTYMGSLTTPPCSEGVLWMVMKQPAQLSADQIGIFARLYPMNARPIQSVRGRMIKESR
jgi:carbonic anhydrase